MGLKLPTPRPPTSGSSGLLARALPSGTPFQYMLTLFVVSFIIYLVVGEVARYRSRIPNLPGPRGLPVVGSLPWLRGKVHAEQYRLWSLKYGDVFQVQLGERTAVIVNSAAAARSLFLGQREAMNSRPLFYVLHGKKRRKVGATAMNKVAVDSYQPTINAESRGFIADLLAASLSNEDHIVDFRDSVRKYAMNLVLTLNYGTRVENIKQLRGDTIFAEMVLVESEISRLRNVSQNYENYIPLLRPIGNILSWVGVRDDKYMAEIGKRRVGYHKALLENLRSEVAAGTDKPCIQGNVLKDPESKGLSEGELLSVSLSMMAGADTSQPTVGWALMLLSQRQDLQQKAYDAIVETDASILSAADVSTFKVEYVDAFTKEVGRYFTALKLGLPRATHDELEANWNGATIPSKTLVFLNAWACSQDPVLFPEPLVFSPERWINADTTATTHLHQYAFGIGGRMCIANHLAHKALYTAFLHLISHFKVLPAVNNLNDPTTIDPLEGLLDKESFVATPKTQFVRLIPRDVARTKSILL
uniref:3-hydroxyphenylacetate 6-hydroxylase n=1 Tax=Bionectria ochroleuca TaxID=29856 RepID=A0A8H7N1A1_BIOOC